MRFDKVIPVVVGSAEHGDCWAVARNISAGGMMIEMDDPLPIGAEVTVHFQIPDSHAEVIARAQVRHQYCFNYSMDDVPAKARGIGLRFVEFIQDNQSKLGQALGRALFRTLH
jgi:hypothetical protein